MAYLGNEPGVGSFIVSTERFNGTGSCTQFSLTQTGIQDPNAIEVLVNSIQQDPINSYSVANGVITFTEAPSSGANNITVTYRATTVITYNNILNSQIPDGTITASKLASGVLPDAKTNAAFAEADSAAAYANAAFGQANNVIGAASYANSAFSAANTGGSAAAYANGAFAQANNDVTNISITSGTFGNAAYYPIITVSANGRINTVSTQVVTGVDAHPFFFTAMGS